MTLHHDLAPGMKYRWLKDALWMVVTGCLAFGVIRAIEFWRAPRRVEPLKAGAIVRIADTGCDANERTLLLATSSACVYCRESSEFHKQLIRVAANERVNTVVVSGRNSDIPDEIASLSKLIQRTAITNLAAQGLVGTPTVVLMERCKAVGVWVGKLGEGQQRTVIGHLRENGDTLTDSSTGKAVAVGRDEVIAASRGALWIDIRDRDASPAVLRAGAVNIPLDELGLRAVVELPLSAPIVVDCSLVGEHECDFASHELRANPVAKVYLFNKGASGATCRRSPT